MEKLLLYGSPTCPRCMVLRKKMEIAGIEFEETHDIQKLAELGFQQLPILCVGGKEYLDFKSAVAYVKELEEK